MKWSILILTQAPRVRFLARLMDMLRPQLYGSKGAGIEVNIKEFDQRYSLGYNRQIMIDEASGEYVNFIDDDDLVATTYVDRISPLLHKDALLADGFSAKVDYVGFQLQCYMDGVPFSRTYHSLKYRGWWNDEKGYYRDISHVNPMRRELALKAWMSGGHGEDSRWATDLRKLGIVRTEHYVDDIMYHYLVRRIKDDSVVPEVKLVRKEECSAAA